MGAVRDALIKLMGAKKTANRMGDIDIRPDDGTGGVMPTTGSELRDARQHAREVQGEDPLATSVQETIPDLLGEGAGADYLRVLMENKAIPKNYLPIPKELKMQRIQNLKNKREREAPRSFMKEHWSPSPPRADKGPADLKRTSPKDPSRLPDSEGALSRQEMIEAMEAEYSFLQKEFERLAGRPPTPDEVQDIGTLENLVDLLKDASGETRVPRASDLNPLADDIPF